MEAKKYVYSFAELKQEDRNLAGGKAANLAVMKQLGLNVPSGFVVTTEACNNFYDAGKKLSDDVKEQILFNLKNLEKAAGRVFGDKNDPLLVSVRSGARVSMPGMMNTVLNIGLNDEIVEGLAKKFNNEWFAYDTYRRFIQMYSDVVASLDGAEFEKIIDDKKHKRGVKLDTELTVDDLKDLIAKFKAVYKKELKEEFPQDPIKQLLSCVEAVFSSWDNKRAIVYRRLNNIPNEWGTAASVQMMVYGNLNEKSASGVAFSRNPATGEKALFGEYLPKAQGEDVVAGVRTPKEINELQFENPVAYEQLVKNIRTLEEHYKDMQDVEFTIEDGLLYMLQTRNGKRTAHAALKIAVDLVKEGKISDKEAVMMMDAKQLDTILHPVFDEKALKKETPLAKGLPASPGAATGKIVFNADVAKELQDKGEKVVLVRVETSPEDIVGFISAEGILTQRGGMTSHAAVVARGMGKCCVAGCEDLRINEAAGEIYIGNKLFKEGDVISIDGFTGNVYGSSIPTVELALSTDYHTMMGWVDKYRVMQVRANADTTKDAIMAYNFGAEGVGLVRTEHMFFEKERLKAIVEMILAGSDEDRQRAISKIMPHQKQDFIGIYREMKGYPVTIRLLDPPLHEFLPKTESEIETFAREMMVSVNTLRRKVESLREFNPMMGHRGVRLDVTYPEIAKMQTQAIIEAAIEVNAEFGFNIVVEIMIPLASDLKEYKYVHDIIVAQAEKTIKEHGARLKYKVGTMIELPRAAILADELAKTAEFFSFGTNDLTQMTYGFSRDDAAKFLPAYYEKKIFEFDPFVTIDQKGVGALVEMAVKKAREINPEFKCGVCGEHGGEAVSVEFFHKVGLNYVSCSPYRVPIARLAAAQANIKYPRECAVNVK